MPKLLFILHMLDYFWNIKLGVGLFALLNSLQVALFLWFWLWEGKENYSPSQTLWVLHVKFTHAVATSLYHFESGL